MMLAAFGPKISDDVSDNGWNDILKTSGKGVKGEWRLTFDSSCCPVG